MKKGTHIQTDTKDGQSRRPALQSFQSYERTEDVMCFPVKVEPLTISTLCFTEEQAAAMLNIPADELLHERKIGAIHYRRLGRYIRYTIADLHEYLENSRICAGSSANTDNMF